MPYYEYDKDYPFAAFITNLGKYNEGELVGEWVRFPTTAEEMKKVFERIGIGQKDDFGNPYEEWFISDYDCYVGNLYDKLGEYENLDELNYLAAKLDDMDRYEYNQFLAAMEMGDHCRNLQEIINLTENLDCYEVYSGIDDYDDLGRYYIEELDVLQVPEHLKNYIDYEAYGRDVAIDENGSFTEFGYVRDTGSSFHEYYDGERGSIPDEYRVMTFQDDLPEEKKSEWAMDIAFDMDEFFRQHDIRLVAVSDNIDTAEGENEMAPIRNLFNEWYARDISKKRRISNKIKGNAGEPMGQPPYGYMKDPDNPKRWIVDDEAAQVVKRIYSMTLDGMGTEQIAAQLEREEILTPRAYWLKKGVKRPGKGKQQPPTKWNSSTITKILSLQEYCGDILNFKTYSKSYKNKKRIDNDRENWVVFKDVHEPIIDRSVWEQVQQKRGKVRKRRTNEGEKNMFSGLLVCADCGNNLHFHFNQGNPEIKYFNCSNYKGNRGTCTSTHYVRVDFLEQVVLGEIKRLTKFASRYEDDFVKAVMGSTQQNVALDRKLKEKELAALQARDEELDGLFERIYEDNVSGKLSDDRFAKMSRRYEDEQKEISEKIKTLRAEMDKLSSKSVTADMFIATVRKYTRAKTLTPRMLNELIDHIEVHQAEKIDGIWEQHLVIHYNCVGAIFIPDVFPLPAPQVSVNTRKGVVVNYAPNQLAV